MRAFLIRLRPWALVLLIAVFVTMEFGRIGNEYWDAVAAGWPDIPSYGRVPERQPEWRPTGMFRCGDDGWLEKEMVKTYWMVIHRHQWTPVRALCPR